MNLYFVRHEKAENTVILGGDFSRDITEYGRKRLKNSVKHWKNIINTPDFVITSPLNRAKQTAEIIVSELGIEKKLYEDKKLACGSRVDDIIEIANIHGEENIMFVGHEPDISLCISALTAGNYLNCDVKKGSIAKVSFAGKARLGSGILEYLIPPEVFLK